MKRRENEMLFLLGLPFHDLTLEEALDDCRALMRSPKPSYVVTANVDFATQAAEDEDLRRIVFFADRVVCDGMPLVWLSRWLGRGLRERVAGSDMVPRLLEICAAEGHAVYFFGSDEKTLEQAKGIAEERFPGLRVAGFDSPPVGAVVEWDNEGICARMKASGAKLLLVCLGCPKQERWIHAHHLECGVPLSIGVGASLDFITGKQVRAPKWMQKTGLEWFWRMSSDPKRMVGRYVTDLKFLVSAGWSEWRLQRRRARPPVKGTVAAEVVGRGTLATRLTWRGSLDRQSLEGAPFPERFDLPLALDLSEVGFLDSVGMGRVALLARKVREAGGRLVISGASDFVRRAFAQAGLTSLLPMVESAEEAEALLAPEGGAAAIQGGTMHVRVALQGSFDATRLEEARRVLETAVATSMGSVTVDLAGVDFIDSRAVGLLVGMKKKLSEHGRDLRLENPSAPVRKVLKLLKLDKVMAWEEVAA